MLKSAAHTSPLCAKRQDAWNKATYAKEPQKRFKEAKRNTWNSAKRVAKHVDNSDSPNRRKPHMLPN